MQIEFSQIDAKGSEVLYGEGVPTEEVDSVEIDGILDAATTEYLNMPAIIQYEIRKKYLPQLAKAVAGKTGEASYALKRPRINDLYYI